MALPSINSDLRDNAGTLLERQSAAYLPGDVSNNPLRSRPPEGDPARRAGGRLPGEGQIRTAQLGPPPQSETVLTDAVVDQPQIVPVRVEAEQSGLQPGAGPGASDGELAAEPTNAFLSRVSPRELPAARSLVGSRGFRALHPTARAVILDHALREPENMRALLAWAGSTAFTRGEQSAQQRSFEQMVASMIAAAPARPLAVRAAAHIDASRIEPRNISVIFPGQRAGGGSRGEFQDAWNRAVQARRLFPNARVNLVLFDPPDTIVLSADHPAMGGRPDGDWRASTADRRYRVYDYMHEVLGRPPWNPSEGSTFQHDGIDIMWGTAPHRGPPTNGAAVGRHGPAATGEQYEVVRDSRGRPLHLALGERSLGYQTIANSDLAIVGGAGDINDPRIFNLGRPGSPNARYNIQFQESGFTMAAGGRVQAIDTSLFSPTPSVFADYSSEHIEVMRRYVQEFRPQPGGNTEALLARRTALLSQMLSPNDAAALARTHWSTAYARLSTAGPIESQELRAWTTALRTSAAAHRTPTTAFVTVPRNRHPEFMRRLQAEFPAGTTRPFANGLTGFRTENINVVLLDQQPQARFRSLVAGSTRPSLLTGNNSLADGVAAGTPLVYETQDGGSTAKIHDLALAAPRILAQAGYPPDAINAFIWALPRLVRDDGQGNVRFVPRAEAGTREAAIRVLQEYQGPDLESVQRLARHPDVALAMWQTVSQAAARDDGQALRAQIMEQLQTSRDPRVRMVAAALNDGSFAGLANDTEFRSWLESPAGATHREVVRSGALIGTTTTGFSVVSAFAGQAFSDVFGVHGMGRVISDMAIGIGVQAQAQQLLATRLGATPGMPANVSGRELFASTIRAMPRGFTTSAAFVGALRAAGVDPGTYGSLALTAGGVTAADLGGTALTNYLRLTGHGRLAGALGAGGRVLGWAGVPLLVDWVAGGAAEVGGTMTSYDTQVASLARRLERDGGTDWLGVILPTTAAALGAEQQHMVNARRIIYETAVATEGAVNRELAGILRNADGSYNRDGFAAFQNWMRDGDTRTALDLITTASMSREHPFRSQLVERLRSISNRADLERFVREELPRITRAQHDRAAADLSREANASDGTLEQRQARLAGILHRMASAAELDDTARRVPPTGISGITDEQIDRMSHALLAGEFFPRDAAAVLLARGGYARWAQNIRNNPETVPQPVLFGVVDQATPIGVRLSRRQGEDLRKTTDAIRGLLAISRALDNDEMRRSVVRDRMERRLMMGSSPARPAELIAWTARHGTAEEQVELTRLLQGARFWTDGMWAPMIRDELRGMGVTLPPTMQPLAALMPR